MDLEILHAVRAKGTKACLLGGRAVALLCESAGAIIPDQLKRKSEDVDLFILRRDRKAVTQTLREIGCTPETEFNVLNGNVRLMFFSGQTKIDIFIDTFQMCHTLHLAGRMAQADLTLSPADLLLTKLQVAEINGKDLTDIAALLLALPLDSGSRLGIDGPYLARCLAKDWGLWKTSTLNLSKLRQSAPELLPRTDGWDERLAKALDRLEEDIESAPKSIAWRARAVVGERVPWYERPEEPDIHAPSMRGGSAPP
jgi:predicted unusual protein kinase regulating ubiquinone biosynthesis (AarF/ABC1/UbiB family)